MIRLIGYFFGFACILFFSAALGIGIYVIKVSKDLPDYAVLNSYSPAITTRVHAGNGALMAEYAKKNRLFLPIQAIPDHVKEAFLSAEDKNFYNHPGVDISGLGRAILNNIQNLGSGRRPEGASTITQQVAKNFLLSSDQTIDRKIKEAILSFRIEQAYSKDKILEFYINEIFFGLNSYGIAAAALTYFNKSVTELNIAEAAYLAALPKGPSNYNPFRRTEAAIARRNWVIDRMAENHYISSVKAEDAKKMPLNISRRYPGVHLFASEYFSEEVRRQIINRYGEKALYEGGLSVRTSLDPHLQIYARKSLQSGLIDYDQRRGFRGPVAHISIKDDWGKPLAKIAPLVDVPEWKLAVVLSTSKSRVEIGLQPSIAPSGKIDSKRNRSVIEGSNMRWAYHSASSSHKTSKSPDTVLFPGDVIYVKHSLKGWKLQQVPKIQGGFIAMDPRTGRVLAMVGGFSFAQSEFNRATQAMRQPGSCFKPFVYAAALDSGYTPASVVMDAPIEIVSGGKVWKPENYGRTSSGPSTLRFGIEKSRNLMTVRLAHNMGMNTVAEYAERFGIYHKMPPLLAMSLGAGETTILRMVSAYAVIANGGKQIEPSLIDRIQDRYGKTIFRQEKRICKDCNTSRWENQDEPEIIDNREQVLDPMTAYQITSMMEGVISRGTAAGKIHIKGPIAGKSGTTNDNKDAFFIGYTPDLVAGLYIGYDNPISLGPNATGGSLAAPIFDLFMQDATKGVLPSRFVIPQGMSLIPVNRRTGMLAREGDPDMIIEAFKPGTGPAEVYSVIDENSNTSSEEILRKSPQANQAINSGVQGLY